MFRPRVVPALTYPRRSFAGSLEVDVDFGKFFSEKARDVAIRAREQNLQCQFDHVGPILQIELPSQALNSALDRLVQGALELLTDGFVYLSARTRLNAHGWARIEISVAGSGKAPPAAQVDAVIQALALRERAAATDTTPDKCTEVAATRVAEGRCPYTAAKIAFAAQRGEGMLFAMDLETRASLLSPESEAMAEGEHAWLIGRDAPDGFHSVARRLQRMGWATTTFDTSSAAQDCLHGLPADAARPALLIVGDGVRIDEVRALRRMLPPNTQCAIVGTKPDLAPDGIDRQPWPLGPDALCALTRRALASAEQSPIAFGDKPCALVVDDNELNLLVAAGLLQVAGFEVKTACSGEEALECCARDAPAVVLMDLHMPGIGGLEATRRLRRMQHDGALPSFAIVAATADALEVGQAACREAGMDGYLAKPLSLRAIQDELHRVLPAFARRRPAR